MTRCLVTGASGFIGTNLVRRLIADGHEVTMSGKPQGQNSCLPWRSKAITKDLHLAFMSGQLKARSFNIVNGCDNVFAVAKPQWIFHLAAYGCYPYQTDFRRMVDVNVHGTRNAIEAAIRHGAEVFVNAGSSSEYGASVTEKRHDGPIRPDSDYAVTKAAQTHLVDILSQGRINAKTLRFFSVYGPWEEPTRLIPQLILHGEQGKLPPLGSPDTPRSFVYIDDAVDTLITAAKSQESGIFNIGKLRHHETIRDPVNWVIAHLNVMEPVDLKCLLDDPTPWNELPPRAYKEPAEWLNSDYHNSRIVPDGWTTLSAGILKTIKWHKETQVWKL